MEDRTMRITMTTDNGELIGLWDIENDFGDIRKKLAQDEMVEAITKEYDLEMLRRS
jgi:hypothetical protein